jgi:class 3 adenylate cyclase
MTCPRCQTENPTGAKFCLECGAPLNARCEACGTPLPAAARFCLECAHPVGRSAVSRSTLEGERKQVTVLIADTKDSLELIAYRDPEEGRKLLDPVLEYMMEAVHRYEGTVNHVIGDGIMALFGAPLAHEDHAVRACYSALQMQESVKRYAEEIFRSHGVLVQIRVGLNSGEVVVRGIGSDLHLGLGRLSRLTGRGEEAREHLTVATTMCREMAMRYWPEQAAEGPA